MVVVVVVVVVVVIVVVGGGDAVLVCFLLGAFDGSSTKHSVPHTGSAVTCQI